MDTNVLLRLADPANPQYPVARDAVKVLGEDGHTLTLVPQTLYEFWAVATRSLRANGLEMSVADARAAVDRFREFFQLRRDERAIFELWLDLTTRRGVRGVNSHDVRLVAAMTRHGLDAILTFNGKDFRRFGGVTVLDPSAVAAGGGD